MSTLKAKGKNEAARQQAYWDALSATYHKITRIDSRDFHYGPQIPGERKLKILPPLRRGMTALELGCGAAQNTLYLARKGLDCTALDVSSAQLRHAAKLAKAENLAPKFLQGSIEHFPRLLADTEPFDFIHSSHAFEFVDDPCACIANVARFLKPGATFMLSTVHPVYNGDWVECENEWGRLLKNYFMPEDDCRDDFGNVVIRSRAYPVSAWFGWLRGAGLDVTQLLEPRAIFKRAPYTSRDWAANVEGELDAIPSTIIFLATKNKAKITRLTRLKNINKSNFQSC